MKTLAIKIAYDGKAYSGWQRQKNAPSVQQSIEEALEQILKQKCPLTGAGRTDSGVHARGQVAHALLPDDFSIPEGKTALAINAMLPQDIRIRAAKVLDYPFHARFDARAREYSYTVSTQYDLFKRHYQYYLKYPISEELLLDSANIFLGEHNFTTFSKDNPDTPNYVCNVEICRWERISAIEFRLTIKANRFVYGMVRALTGAMLDIARGKREVEELRQSLEKADRQLISPLAPPHGLVLEKIYYSNNMFAEK